MKRVVKVLFVLMLSLLLVMPYDVMAAKKVKVYMFEAGGCPHCEAEQEDISYPLPSFSLRYVRSSAEAAAAKAKRKINRQAIHSAGRFMASPPIGRSGPA